MIISSRQAADVTARARARSPTLGCADEDMRVQSDRTQGIRSHAKDTPR